MATTSTTDFNSIKSLSETFPIPGTAAEILYTRNEAGCLLEISINGRVYLRYDKGQRIFDDGFVSMSQAVTPGGILRTVRTGNDTWCEKYLWDATGLMTYVDGVEMDYDEGKRIAACRTPEGVWRYEYDGEDLSAIATPRGRRKVQLSGANRPTAYLAEGRINVFSYDDTGRRTDVPSLPPTHHVDDLGRLWTIKDRKGNIRHTFIWDGFYCLGRIDGYPGNQLAAVFSLDCTGTPVRIITRTGVTRIYRDAFGEALLDHDAVPGLFGATIYGRFLHYRSRLLDPRSGYFTAPDPLDGSLGDPRREDGYSGPLPVEKPFAGPYCLCQNNPVSRADFEGESSGGWTFLMALSDLTWSLQNNIVGWLGYDGFLSLWGSIFSGNAGRYGWSRGVHSDRTGSYGVLRDGVIANDRAKTFQHIIIVNQEAIELLADVCVFAPEGEFVPTYCGSVLLVTPEEGKPFLLRGARRKGSMIDDHLPLTWTRYGGQAKPVIPGSPLPAFPKGGFHFAPQADVHGPQAADCSECVTGTKLATGNLDERFIVEIGTTGTGIAQDSWLLLTDGVSGYAIAKVLAVEEKDDKTRLRMDVTASTFAAINLPVSVRRLTSRGTEDLPKGAQPDALDCAAATQNYYHVDDPLRITQEDTVLSTSVKQFDAEITVDEALPGDFSGAVTLTTAQAQEGPFEAKVSATANTISFVKDDGSPSPTIPETGDFIIATSASASLALKITGPGANADTDRLVDRDPAALGPADTDLSWQFLRPLNNDLGTVSPPPAGTTFVFHPTGLITSAPAFVKFSDSSNPIKTAVRAVSGIGAQSIVTADNLPTGAGPCTVECFSKETPADTGPYDNRILTSELTLVMDPVDAVTTAKALQLHQINGTSVNDAAPGAATISGVTIAQHATSSRWYAAHSTAAGNSAIKPSSYVYLRQGTDIQTGLIDEIRGLLEFTGSVTVDGSGLELVPLEENGPRYYGERKDDTHVTILPFIDVGATKTRVQMPRFRENEILRVTFKQTGSPDQDRLYRIKSVSGTTCEVDCDGTIAATATDIRASRMIPANPNTGWSRIGIDGIPDGTAGADGKVTTDKINFKLYDLRPRYGVASVETAIVSGDSVIPARMKTTAFNYEIYFAGDPPLTGANIDILAPDTTKIDTGFAASFRREGNAFLLDGTVANVVGGTKPVIVVPLVETDKKTHGTLSPGSTLVPEDPETWEFDRQKSLIEHELIHTRQCCWLGPILTSYIPLGAIEGLFEATTEAEDPTYSPYISARLEDREGDWYLVIPSPGETEFEEGTPVDISKAGRSTEVDLGPGSASSGFRLIRPLSDYGPGDVYIRRRRSNWQGVPEWIINILQILTHGGIMNATVGTVYGGLFFLIYRGFYGLYNKFGENAGRYYDVTFEDNGGRLQLTGDEGLAALRGANRVIVRSGETTVVREVASMTGRDINISSRVSFTGAGGVSPYTTHDPTSIFDPYSYYPASVANPDQPARITIQPADGDSLSLEVYDRLKMLVGNQSKTTVVMAVDGNSVELKDAPPLPDGETSLRVAKVGHDDAMGWVDDWLLEYFDMQWMKWLFDPYGQIDYQFRPSNWTQTFTRITRYIFGTQSWCVIPGAGFFWHDNAFQQIKNPPKGHMSRMEQEASEESGDLYSPLSRLRNTPRYVGDIGRFWYFAWPNRTSNAQNPEYPRYEFMVITQEMMDAPGVHYNDEHKPRLLPLVDTSGAAPAISVPNDKGKAPTDSGECLADGFTRRDWADPNNPTETLPDSFAPADTALLPTSATLERCGGTYLTFTRSGKHRISIPNTTRGDIADSMEVQEWGRQRIYYEVDIEDVDVTCAGMTATNGSIVTLLETQQARIRVTPNNTRRYALAVTDPASGNFIRATDTVLTAQTPNSADEQPVEISRRYAYNAADGSFDDAELNFHKTHFFGDIHVPVRQFSVKVVRDLFFRSAIPTLADLTADFNVNKISLVRPGETAYLLVPSAITEALNRIGVSYPGEAPSSGNIDPQPAVTSEDPVPEGYADYLGDGLIVKVTFPATEPPQEETLMNFRIGIGQSGNTTRIEPSLTLKPYFMLRSASGYQVPVTGSMTLTCEVDPADPAVRATNVIVTPSQGVTTSISADGQTITITTAGASTGTRTIKAEDADHAGRFAVRTIEVV
jgi:hypothetical protein